MKKVLSILLSLSMIFLLFGIFTGAVDDDEMKVFVTSDTHWEKYDSVNPDGFYRPRQSFGQNTALSPQIFREFLNDAESSDIDYVFITGDLTDSGSTASSRAYAALLADFEARSGKQVFVVPGNHDLDMDDVPDDHLRFREIFNDFGYAEAFDIEETTSSYAVELKNDYILLGVNSNKSNGGGIITDELMNWIGAQAEKANAEGKKVIALMHQHLLEHYTMEQKVDDFYIIDNYKELRKNFAKWNIRYTFTGHLHISDIASYDVGENPVYDITSPCLVCYPLTYRSVVFSPKKVQVSSRQISKIDTSDLVPGYSDEQKEMIENDLAGYIYGCQQDSFIEDYVKDFVNPEYLADLLGFEKGGSAEAALKRIIPDVLIPLYGEGETVEAKAKQLGIKLPKSDYENVEDLLTAFWAAFVAGDENLGGSSLEGRLVIDAAYVLILANVSNESEAVQKLLTKKLSATFGLNGINNIFTRKALDIILTGFFVDKAPGDNNVTLTGYEIRTDTITYKIFTFIEKLFDFIKRVLTSDFFKALTD